MKRYDDQLFARCHKNQRRMVERAARAMELSTSQFIRDAVLEKASRVDATERAHPGAYRERTA